MASQVFLINPSKSLEDVVTGVGAAIQSSFIVSITVDLGTSDLTEGGTTRQIKKAEVQQAIRTLEEYILRDTAAIWG